jgi:hypothetical protein
MPTEARASITWLFLWKGGGIGKHMGRGEMIRRLDEAARDVHERLENGPLSPDERHALAATLTRLLPLVANSLQDEEDRDAAQALLRRTPNSQP